MLCENESYDIIILAVWGIVALSDLKFDRISV